MLCRNGIDYAIRRNKRVVSLLNPGACALLRIAPPVRSKRSGRRRTAASLRWCVCMGKGDPVLMARRLPLIPVRIERLVPFVPGDQSRPSRPRGPWGVTDAPPVTAPDLSHYH